MAALSIAVPVVVAFATGWFARRKAKAEATDLIADAAASVTQTMRAEIERLTERIADLERRVSESDREGARLRRKLAALHRHVDQLEAIMTAAGLEPPERPRHGPGDPP